MNKLLKQLLSFTLIFAFTTTICITPSFAIESTLNENISDPFAVNSTETVMIDGIFYAYSYFYNADNIKAIIIKTKVTEMKNT